MIKLIDLQVLGGRDISERFPWCLQITKVYASYSLIWIYCIAILSINLPEGGGL